jgi:hypothetical protein
MLLLASTCPHAPGAAAAAAAAAAIALHVVFAAASGLSAGPAECSIIRHCKQHQSAVASARVAQHFILVLLVKQSGTYANSEPAS